MTIAIRIAIGLESEARIVALNVSHMNQLYLSLLVRYAGDEFNSIMLRQTGLRRIFILILV